MIIGITGSISSGKSLVSNYLKQKNYFVIESDAISKEILRKDSLAYNEVLNVFLSDILDEEGNINRKKLRDIIFSNEEKRIILNNITHKYILKEIDRQINMNSDKELIFIDAPLLFETNLDKKVDKVIVVTISEEEEINRLIKRDKIDAKYAKKIIATQYSQDLKIKKADYIIDNNGSIINTYNQIDEILKILN